MRYTRTPRIPRTARLGMAWASWYRPTGQLVQAFPVVTVPARALRRARNRQSVMERDVYGPLDRRFGPQSVTDHIASLGIYRSI